MGFYGEQVLPRLIDKMCGAGDMAEWRRKAVAGLTGTVVEIGFGSGLNVPHYPPTVERVLAVEPSAVARKLAAPRIAASSVPVEFVGLDGQGLPLGDASVDAALSTFTLCTIPDERKALRELLRVLRPGGRLHVVEHGSSGDEKVQHRQRRIEPINKRLAGGCHLTRDHWATIRAAGFEIESATTEMARGPKTHSVFYVGVARKPEPADVTPSG
jgi:ubiquinone/menaquinone biosynthesis C-methylase UbiE